MNKDLYYRMGIFSKQTFKGSDTVGHLKKLKEEADEAIETPENIDEYADCFLTLFAACYKQGFTFEEIEKSVEEKFNKIRERKYKIGDNGLYQHY